MDTNFTSLGYDLYVRLWDSFRRGWEDDWTIYATFRHSIARDAMLAHLKEQDRNRPCPMPVSLDGLSRLVV